MPERRTKRGVERTPLDGEYDVLICGASFAGLAVARELAGAVRADGSPARVLMLDRYEVGERQTSACGIPTVWLEALDLMGAHRQTFGELVVTTPHGNSRWPLPWTFSTFDYPELCRLLRAQGDCEFETAKVNGRSGDTIHTDRGDLSAPLELRQRDELGELANEINLMCERLAEEQDARARATEQLRHADRLTTVGKLASGLAHELGTPLNVVSGRSKLIADREVEGQDVVDSARIVAEQADRMTALIRQLLDFARPRALRPAPLNITTLAGRVCQLVATIARKANVKLIPPAPDESLRLEADDGQLTQVLTNLIVNAIQSIAPIQAPGASGTVEIVARTVDQVPPPYVGGPRQTWMAIEVRDTGTGMDDATRERIFEPFFTTKQVGDGTGLGLSVSWGIVREHGGWIDIASSPGAGATFTVYLPRGDA